MTLPQLDPSEWALSAISAGVALWFIAVMVILIAKNAFGYRAPEPGHLPLGGFLWLGLGTAMIVGGWVAFLASLFFHPVR